MFTQKICLEVKQDFSLSQHSDIKLKLQTENKRDVQISFTPAVILFHRIISNSIIHLMFLRDYYPETY